MVESMSKVREQIEYYLGDINLSRDKFFREQIQTDKEGYISVTHFLNCNNVKKQGWKTEDIIAACKDSTLVEIKGQKVRRAGNKELPEFQVKKREVKANDKKPEQEKIVEDQLDERGRPILVEKDFDNPLIVTYATVVAKGEEFKVDWKLVEAKIKEEYPGLKLIYSRMDDHGGHLAFSQLRLKHDLMDDLIKNGAEIQERPFTFEKTTGDELKEFWQKQGGHFQFCI